MRTPPSPIYENKSGRTSFCLVFTILITGGLFIILPLTQLSSRPTSVCEKENTRTATLTPPPKLPEPPEQPEEENVEDDKIELIDPLPPVTLRDMIHILNDFHGDGVNRVIKGFNDLDFEEQDLVFTVVDLDTPPKPRSQSAPAYPSTLKRSGIEGYVEVVYIVTATGGVRSISIVSATNREFVDSVRNTLKRWSFEPGKIDEKPVNTRVRQRFDFTLDR